MFFYVSSARHHLEQYTTLVRAVTCHVLLRVASLGLTAPCYHLGQYTTLIRAVPCSFTCRQPGSLQRGIANHTLVVSSDLFDGPWCCFCVDAWRGGCAFPASWLRYFGAAWRRGDAGRFPHRGSSYLGRRLAPSVKVVIVDCACVHRAC